MQPSTWERLEAIFFEALALDPAARSDFVQRACAGDADLRAEVEAVLAAHLAVEGEEPPETPPDRRVGSRVGAYRLEELLGRGGMGEVFLARRADDQYEQVVAVKIVRSGLPPYEMARRFRLERQILARLEHPNVAMLLDGGITEEGQPYLVMQHVDGVPITEYVDARRLPVRERLRLFATVCRAVQYAHTKLVVHRDLKPSNILVTEDGQVRLLDFGIAKLLDPEGTQAADATQSLLLMTPEHAAPEQFLGLSITTATDVYQLGVLLYELLAGRRPFRASTSPDLHRAISEHEAARPSTSIGWDVSVEGGSDTVAEADTARARGTTPEGLRRQLRGDLDRVVLMALRKDPERRYGSVAALADDVERHLSGFPVHARPEDLGYVVGRFVHRHRVGVIASVGLAASLVALVAISLRFAATTSRQAAAISTERDVAVEVSSFLEGLFEASDPFASESDRRDTLRVRDLLDEGADRVRTGLADQPLVQARLLTSLGNAYRNLGRLDAALPLLEEAVEIRHRAAGPESAELANSRAALAQVLVARGELDEAEPLLRSSVAVFERDSVTHARSLAMALGALGGLLQDGGRYPESEDTYRRALSIIDADSTVDGGARAEHVSNLATALSQQAKFDEAEILLRRAVGLARGHLGDDHPTTAIMLNNLGSVLRDLNELDDAEEQLREALAIRRARLDSLHPATAVSVNNLADLLIAKGDPESAEPLFRRSLEMRRAIYGETHPAVGVAWLNLGAALQEIDGRQDEAVRSYDAARSLLEATLGPSHPAIGGIDGNLARLFHAEGDHERALDHYRAALAVRRASYDPSHPLVLGNLSEIGRCLTELARHEEAEATLLEAFGVLEPLKDQQDRLWDVTLIRLGRLYGAMGDEDEAARFEAMRPRPVS